MILRGIIAAVLMIALTLVSFGHQSLSPQTEAQADAYILAGGDWADLCGDSGDPLAQVTKCMACLISHACAVPHPSNIAESSGLEISLVWSNRHKTLHLAKTYAPQSARAPPVQLV